MENNKVKKVVVLCADNQECNQDYDNIEYIYNDNNLSVPKFFNDNVNASDTYFFLNKNEHFFDDTVISQIVEVYNKYETPIIYSDLIYQNKIQYLPKHNYYNLLNGTLINVSFFSINCLAYFNESLTTLYMYNYLLITKLNAIHIPK